MAMDYTRKFKRGERVTMLKSDSWTKTGAVGTVSCCDRTGVQVRWDISGVSYWHKVEAVGSLKETIRDPNLAFSLRDK